MVTVLSETKHNTWLQLVSNHLTRLVISLQTTFDGATKTDSCATNKQTEQTDMARLRNGS